MIYRLYRLVAALGWPMAWLVLQVRVARGKEDPRRLAERFGRTREARPTGRLFWFHGASVGESLSLLPLIRALLERDPALNILVTTGTVTSAEILKARLPARAQHRFVPVDCPQAVARFLDHWRPDLGVWVESEFWPNLILGAERRAIPLALINARLSARSARRWRRAGFAFRALLGRFDKIFAQSEEALARLTRLGAGPARHLGNLKYAADPLPVKEALVHDSAARLRDRPVWMAASTHPGEEEIVAAAHREIAKDHPALLTVLAPRHPNRGDSVARLLERRGLNFARRSRGEMPTQETDIWLIDTIGELGTFFRLAPVVLVGGSLVPHGGHNLLEPAQFGAAILTGPHMENFTEIMARPRDADAVRPVRADDLAASVSALLRAPEEREALARRARAAAAAERKIVDLLVEELLELDKARRPASDVAGTEASAKNREAGDARA